MTLVFTGFTQLFIYNIYVYHVYFAAILFFDILDNYFLLDSPLFILINALGVN